jgi:hypothetical protein
MAKLGSSAASSGERRRAKGKTKKVVRQHDVRDNPALKSRDVRKQRQRCVAVRSGRARAPRRVQALNDG